MRKVILSVVLATGMAAGASAQNDSWRERMERVENAVQTERRNEERKNSVAVSLSAMGFFGNKARSFGNVALEYDHMWRKRLSVSYVGLYAPICPPGEKVGTYPREGAFWMAAAKFNYIQPVVRGWLYFRVGAGLGIGVQHRHEPAGAAAGIPPTHDTRIYPHLLVDANWLLRVSRNVDVKIAPLLLSPSMYVFGIGAKLHREGDTPFEYSNLFTVGAAVRF